MLPQSFVRLPNNKKLLIVVGPTSSGKTELALKLAKNTRQGLLSIHYCRAKIILNKANDR